MRGWAGFAAWLVVPALGCSATVADDEGQARSASTQAAVTVERSVDVSDGTSAPAVRTRVLARFVQVSGGIDHDFAERVVGSPRDLPPAGSCEWRSANGLKPIPDVAADGAIDLLDVGDVVLHAGDSSLPLAPRAFPDVGDLVSGIVYSSRDDTTPLPADEPYEIETTGSDFSDAFRLSIDAPPAPADVRLAGAELADAELVLPWSGPLGLSWTAGADAGDQIVVELLPLGADDDQPTAIRCVFDDRGRATVPEAFVAWAEEVDELEVAVHRIRRVILQAPEIDEAVVEFDFAVAAHVPVSYAP